MQAVVAFGGAQHAEEQTRPGERLPGVVQREDDVLESRLVAVGDDGVDFGVVERHAPLEGGHEVFGADPVEGRNAVGRVPFAEQGIFAGGRRGVAGSLCHKQQERMKET